MFPTFYIKFSFFYIMVKKSLMKILRWFRDVINEKNNNIRFKSKIMAYIRDKESAFD